MKLIQIQINTFLLLALLLSLNAKATQIFLDNFNDGNANGWTVVDDTSAAPSWQVIEGEYKQLNNVESFVQSFYKRTYSYYSGGLDLTNYYEVTDEPHKNKTESYLDI